MPCFSHVHLPSGGPHPATGQAAPRRRAIGLARCATLCLATLPLWLAQHPASAGEYTERHDNIPGMEISLTLVGLADDEARRVGSALLEDINRLSHTLGTHQNDSELARLNQEGGSEKLSAKLASLLHLCEEWRDKTSGAFSCRQGEVLELWRDAERKDAMPDRTALRQLARDIDARPWPTSGEDVDLHGIRIEPGRLSTGFILDTALSRLHALAPEVSGVKLNIGDHAIYWGRNGNDESWQATLAIPSGSSGNATFPEAPSLGVLDLGILAPGAQDIRAIAFSGPSHDFWRIGDRRFHRTINPTEAWPVTFSPSAVVVAGDAVTASVLAEALAVMPTATGIALIDQFPDVEALVVTESGKTFASQGWYALLVPDHRHQPLWSEDWRFLVEYRIPAHNTAEYRRPYVALWITDEERNLVRQLVVHGESRRWLREVPLWWRRHGRRDESVIDGLARPTPPPGRHLLTWDGRDDRGGRVPAGHYTLHVEASREHGGREVVTVPFSLSDQPFEGKAKGDAELEVVRISFGPGR